MLMVYSRQAQAPVVLTAICRELDDLAIYLDQLPPDDDRIVDLCRQVGARIVIWYLHAQAEALPSGVSLSATVNNRSLYCRGQKPFKTIGELAEWVIDERVSFLGALSAGPLLGLGSDYLGRNLAWAQEVLRHAYRWREHLTGTIFAIPQPPSNLAEAECQFADLMIDLQRLESIGQCRDPRLDNLERPRGFLQALQDALIAPEMLSAGEIRRFARLLALAPEPPTEGQTTEGTVETGPKVKTRKTPKRSSRSSDAELFIAALLVHHQYNNGGCGNYEPVTVRGLAETLNVAPATATRRFNKQFPGSGNEKGHAVYSRHCLTRNIATVLKHLENPAEVSRLLANPGEYAAPVADDED